MIKSLSIVFVSLIVFVVYIRYLESVSIFYPNPILEATPADINLPYEDIYCTTVDNVRLHGWFVKNPRAKATILFFHGNAGNISHRLERIKLLYERGLNVCIIDYRGYGESTGKPSEQGLYKDVRAAFDYLATRNDIDAAKIIIYGVSLGGVAAIDLATNNKAAALIVDSSFTSSADMCRVVYPFVPTFLLATKMDSIAKVSRVTMPKLFIHSTDDEIVPIQLAKKLFNAAGEPKEFLEITGGHNTGHTDSWDLYAARLDAFLEKYNLR